MTGVNVCVANVCCCGAMVPLMQTYVRIPLVLICCLAVRQSNNTKKKEGLGGGGGGDMEPGEGIQKKICGEGE